MSEENKDEKTVRDLSPDKDPKGGIGTKPPDSGDTNKGVNPNKGQVLPVPPVPGIN